MSEDRAWNPGMRSLGAINRLRNNYVDATAPQLFLNCDLWFQDQIRSDGTLHRVAQRAKDIHNGVSKAASKALIAQIRKAVGWVTIHDCAIKEPPTKRRCSYQWGPQPRQNRDCYADLG